MSNLTAKTLVIVHDYAMQLLLQEALNEQGCHVFVATSGKEGIRLAQELHPALIICDWMMEEINGLDICHQIKADPALSITFFILLASRQEISDRTQGLDWGVDEFLTKPIEITELKARVRAVLRLYQVNQDLQIKNRALETLSQSLQKQTQALEVEFAEAAKYIRSLLPLPWNSEIAIDTCFLPSKELGGDCFDYYWLDSDYLMIYLLDVSGHGLAAALPSISIFNLLRTQSLPNVSFYHPSQVLTALNEIFQPHADNGKYFTIWYGIYNRIRRKLIYSSAGHPPAILISGNSKHKIQVQQLHTSGLPIGVLQNTRYVNRFCPIEDTSTLYLFSDGIYEVRKTQQTVVGLDGLTDLLVQLHLNESKNFNDLLKVVRGMSMEGRFKDDVSLIKICFN